MRGHIRERSPGRWAIILDIRDPGTGKRKRKWHSFRGTKKQAQTECSRLITEMSRGAYVEPSRFISSNFWISGLNNFGRKFRLAPMSAMRN